MSLLHCRDEFKMDLKAHEANTQQGTASAPPAETPVTRDHLVRVFTASAIPFVGFGFLDNLIMVRKADLALVRSTGDTTWRVL